MNEAVKDLINLKKKVNQAHDLLVESIEALREKDLLSIEESETIGKFTLSTRKLRTIIENEIGRIVSE